ncbi:MAG: exonuclease domain-containing protein [Thalassobaculaceae bacterium]|nr:exonuclease domain-containing protein [Thalassobaculaceae bacterium]
MTLYLVTDIETDGPEPSENSMLSLATVACAPGRGIVETYTINLAPQTGHAPHPETAAWWRTQPEAWTAATSDPVAPETAMARWADWVRGLPEPRVFVAHPVSFDGKWVDWYLRRYLGLPLDRGPMAGERLFARSALDLPSLIAGRLGWDPVTLHEKRYPAEWLGAVPHSHRAIDDALGYAHLLLTVLALPVSGGGGRTPTALAPASGPA